jgi:hypothetical protein
MVSCSSLPTKSNGTGMLFVPINKDEVDSSNYFVNYRVVTDSGKVFYLHPEKHYSLIRGFEPGRYETVYFEAMYKESGKLWYDNPIRISFEIEEDKITVLDYRLNVDFQYKDGKTYQRAKFVPLTEYERNIFIFKFQKKNELGIWTIE